MKKFALYAPLVITLIVAGVLVANGGRRIGAEPVVAKALDLGSEQTVVQEMRTCVMQVSSQGLTTAGLDQAHRLCWNRAELVGKKHKEK